jgi:hypothetical protein
LESIPTIKESKSRNPCCHITGNYTLAGQAYPPSQSVGHVIGYMDTLLSRMSEVGIFFDGSVDVSYVIGSEVTRSSPSDIISALFYCPKLGILTFFSAAGFVGLFEEVCQGRENQILDSIRVHMSDIA